MEMKLPENPPEYVDYSKRKEANAKLQQKKHDVREQLKDMGVQKRKGKNAFDKYSYFTESQYKELFTRLFADAGLELTANVKSVQLYKGSEKQPHGRIVEVEYTLTDIETGYAETSTIHGDGVDKGDKGLYKAYTGSLKYYLANNFLVATGDDPEVQEKEVEKKITAKQAKNLGQLIEMLGVDVNVILDTYEHKELKDFTAGEYANCIKRLEATKKKKEEEDA